jgi:hypothetical protein
MLQSCKPGGGGALSSMFAYFLPRVYNGTRRSGYLRPVPGGIVGQARRKTIPCGHGAEGNLESDEFHVPVGCFLLFWKIPADDPFNLSRTLSESVLEIHDEAGQFSPT